MKRLFSLFLASLLLASCSQHLIVNFSDRTTDTGSLVIQPSRRIYAFLDVDGKLLVEDKNVKKITVNQIPVGQHVFHLICDNSQFQEKVDETKDFTVQPGSTSTHLLEVPPFSNGYWISKGLYGVGAWAGLVFWLSMYEDDE